MTPLQTVFDSKLFLELSCRASWPLFLSYEEDFHFMSEVYRLIYDGKRIIFWDNTNKNIAKPSCADFQRSTWSTYYASNCLKFGVGLQLAGWMLVWFSWTGAVSDTQYNGEGDKNDEKKQILKVQWDFTRNDLVDGTEIPFTNTTDKGYRLTSAAWQYGHQLVLQPDFKTSDAKFSDKQTISSSTVASHRSGNERAVKYAKLPGILNSAESGNIDYRRIDDILMASGFQCNFMYKLIEN